MKSSKSFHIWSPATLSANDVTFLKGGSGTRVYILPRAKDLAIRLALPFLESSFTFKPPYDAAHFISEGLIPIDDLMQHSNPAYSAEATRFMELLTHIKRKCYLECYGTDQPIDWRGPTYPELLVTWEREDIYDTYESLFANEDWSMLDSEGKPKRSRLIPVVEIKTVTLRPYKYEDKKEHACYLHLSLRLVFPYRQSLSSGNTGTRSSLPQILDTVPSIPKVKRKAAAISDNGASETTHLLAQEESKTDDAPINDQMTVTPIKRTKHVTEDNEQGVGKHRRPRR